MSKEPESAKQKVRICFFEFECWKCRIPNHIYFAYWIENPYSNSQDFVSPDETETMWNGKSLVFRPDIIEAVKKYMKSNSGKNLRVGEIKPRYSNTAEDYYPSFGCYQCDVIFGDWYVMDATLEARYDEDKLTSFEITIPGKN